MDIIHINEHPGPVVRPDDPPDEIPGGWPTLYEIVVEPAVGRTRPELPMLGTSSSGFFTKEEGYFWIDTAAQYQIERPDGTVWCWVCWAHRNRAPENYPLVAKGIQPCSM